MAWVILYSVLVVAFSVSFRFPASGHLLPSEIITKTAALVGSILSLTQALARVNLNIYLALQRIRIWFSRRETSHWQFALRVDDPASDDPLKQICDSLTGTFGRWEPRVALNKSPRKLYLVLDRTIHLNLSFVPADESEDGASHLLIDSDELEIGFANSASKLEDTVIPILTGFLEVLRPQQSSAMFTVSFAKVCPFFSFYVEHLKPEQVTHFNLVFLPRLAHGPSTDRVTVTTRSMEITTGTLDAMKRLATTLLTLSSDAAALTRG